MVNSTPLGRVAAGKNIQYPLIGRLGGPRSRYGRFGEGNSLLLYRGSNPGSKAAGHFLTALATISSSKWAVPYGIGHIGIQGYDGLHRVTRPDGLALSSFPNLVFRHLVRLFGCVITPSQGLSVCTEQHRRIRLCPQWHKNQIRCVCRRTGTLFWM